MEQLAELPKRVTPTEARARLLRSLIAQKKAPGQEAELDKLNETSANFIRLLLYQD